MSSLTQLPNSIIVKLFYNLLFSTPTLIRNSDDVREKMKSKYLSNPDYNFEKVNRASMACGPMVKWAIAQVSRFS